MKKIIFLYSGEGTQSSDSNFKLLKYSRCWIEIEKILDEKFDLDLESVWRKGIGTHRCPWSPLLTVVSGICLSDIWQNWGYKPDVVVGHSIGELAAAYQAGFYSLEDILSIAIRLGEVTAELDGAMLHGTLTDEQIDQLPQYISSLNFIDGISKHVTISGRIDEMEEFQNSHPDFFRMRIPHPWHHPGYEKFSQRVNAVKSDKIKDIEFVSGITARFETQLQEDHWRKWLASRVDFIGAMQAIDKEYHDHHLDIIEIGFHPILDKCCEVFGDYNYFSSMYRGEDEIKWILHQRAMMDQKPFMDKVGQVVESFRPGLDYKTSLAYQGFTSRIFVEFAGILAPLFPSLAPQDFYRYKSIEQLVQQFGVEKSIQFSTTRNYQRNAVVIAGMSCKFPSSVENPTQFWNLLLDRKDQVGTNANRGTVDAGYLDDTVSRFDHKYFNIAEAEAATMDPQQILALELTELLWKDAGIDPNALDRRRVGVYIGAWNQEYSGDRKSVYYPTGTNPSIIASRVSYHYDLRGPSWVVNTACSSSLVAVHYAAKDIEAGRIDFAIAGGVNMILGDDFSASMMNAGFLSKDYRCKAFDDSANGYARGEGGGLVLLANKEFVERFYAELAGSSVNQNGGRSQVITAPHPEAQEELILDACKDAAITPHDIAYLECHGTGTKIGDPIEISAIQNTLAAGRKEDLHIGSVKSNIGHLESAAGIAGLIKAVLSAQHGVIPPNLHFSKPNRYIDFESHHLNVIAKETKIDHQANIGISSFGFGGANAHVIIKGACDEERKALKELAIPFERQGALPLNAYFQLDSATGLEAKPHVVVSSNNGVREAIHTFIFNLSGVEEIEPDIELYEQGLDSMSATELIHNLEQEFHIELDPDILFDYPLIDQLVDIVEEKAFGNKHKAEAGSVNRGDIEKIISDLFYKLTSVEEIDADVELTDQGLDSMSGTELIAQLETSLNIEIDPDILFEYPLRDQLVDEIHAMVQQRTPATAAS